MASQRERPQQTTTPVSSTRPLVRLLASARPPSPSNGEMIVSDRDHNLAINAWNGAQFGTVLRLHNACKPDNPDCTWTYHNGMLISDRDPNLAINAWNGAQFGTVLRLHNACKPDNPDCTWNVPPHQ